MYSCPLKLTSKQTHLCILTSSLTHLLPSPPLLSLIIYRIHALLTHVLLISCLLFKRDSHLFTLYLTHPLSDILVSAYPCPHVLMPPRPSSLAASGPVTATSQATRHQGRSKLAENSRSLISMEVIWRGRSRAPDQTAEGGSGYCGNTADALHPAEGTPERGGVSTGGRRQGGARGKSQQG